MGANPMTHLPSMMGPPPPLHHMPHQPHHQGPIPLAMIARINADIDNQLQLQEQQQIEEHIIPIFQQLLPELRPVADNHEHHKHEAEDRAMPNKVLYHPAMAEGRSLYTVAISDKPNGEGHIMHQPMPSEATMRQNAQMFKRVPMPVSMMIQQTSEPITPQENSNDENKSDHRLHCKY